MKRFKHWQSNIVDAFSNLITADSKSFSYSPTVSTDRIEYNIFIKVVLPVPLRPMIIFTSFTSHF